MIRVSLKMPSVRCCACDKWIKKVDRRHRKKQCLCARTVHYACYSCDKKTRASRALREQGEEPLPRPELTNHTDQFELLVQDLLTDDVVAILQDEGKRKRGRPSKLQSTLAENTIRKKMKREMDDIKNCVENFQLLLKNSGWNYKLEASLKIQNIATQKVTSSFSLGEDKCNEEADIHKLAFLKTKFVHF